jgi:hypothetical protein
MMIGKAEITAATKKPSSAIEQLERAKADLAAAQVRSEALASTEADARSSADTYSDWRASRDAIDVEIERLSGLAASLEEPADRERERNAVEAVRKRHAEKVKSNAALARRIRDDVARANAILVPLLCDLAASNAEDFQLNGHLPDDLDPIVGADFLARAKPGLPRKKISSKIIQVWVKRDHPDFVIGDQDSVESRDGHTGLVKVGQSTFVCIKIPFCEISYHPEEPMQRPEPLTAMRLLSGDEPGLLYDGSRCADPRSTIAALNQVPSVSERRERPIETEMTPIPTIADANASAEGAR